MLYPRCLLFKRPPFIWAFWSRFNFINVIERKTDLCEQDILRSHSSLKERLLHPFFLLFFFMNGHVSEDEKWIKGHSSLGPLLSLWWYHSMDMLLKMKGGWKGTAPWGPFSYYDDITQWTCCWRWKVYERAQLLGAPSLIMMIYAVQNLWFYSYIMHYSPVAMEL